jgi:hypothetical protein
MPETQEIIKDSSDDQHKSSCPFVAKDKSSQLIQITQIVAKLK